MVKANIVKNIPTCTSPKASARRERTIIVIVITIIAIALLIVLGVGGYSYWNKWKKSKTEAGLETLKTGEAAEKISESAARAVLPSIETNPLENKPNINPVDAANPIKKIKTNPFE